MRKASLGLGLLCAAGAGGLALAGGGLSPIVGALAGLCLLVGVVIFYGVGTDQLALFAVSAMVFTITWNGIRVGGGALGNVTMVLAFLAVVTYAVVQRRSLPLPPWLFVAGMLALLAGLLSMVFPPSINVLQRSALLETTFKLQDGFLGLAQPFSDQTVLVEYLLALVFVPLMIATVGTTAPRCARLINLWTAGAIVNACVGILDYGGIAHLAQIPLSDHRSAGLTVQSNYLALTCVLALPTAMLWLGRSRRSTLAGAFGVSALLGGVYASGSRAGTVAAGLAVLATIVLIPRMRPALRTILPIAGMVLVVVLMFTSVGTKILHQIRLGSSNSTALSDYQRSDAAQAAWAQIQARPLEGVGFAVITNAHDIYLELLDAGGVILLAAFFVFCGGIASCARRALVGNQREEAVALSIAMLMWLANGVFDNQVADKYLYVVPGLILAVSQAAVLLAPAAPARRRSLGRPIRPAGVQPGAEAAPAGVT